MYDSACIALPSWFSVCISEEMGKQQFRTSLLELLTPFTKCICGCRHQCICLQMKKSDSQGRELEQVLRLMPDDFFREGFENFSKVFRDYNLRGDER